jgi:bifunctional non-homologous end joining protein LigD
LPSPSAGRAAAPHKISVLGRKPAPNAVRSSVPFVQPPQLCTLVEHAPEEGDWISEIKFDGYRLLIAIEGRSVRLLTRNGHDWSDRLPAVHATIKALGLSIS